MFDHLVQFGNLEGGSKTIQSSFHIIWLFVFAFFERKGIITFFSTQGGWN